MNDNGGGMKIGMKYINQQKCLASKFLFSKSKQPLTKIKMGQEGRSQYALNQRFANHIPIVTVFQNCCKLTELKGILL